MRTSKSRHRPKVRSLFVSDVHLGCRHAQTAEFLQFLLSVQPEQIYLVGDFIDGWRLRKSLRWEPIFNDILARLYELHEQGTRIYYTPGNHDDFLRAMTWNFGFVTVCEEFIFKTADGRRFLVLHGDKFDCVERAAKWVSMLATVGYDVLLTANCLISRFRRTKPQSQLSFSNTLKRRVKQAVRYISDFERRLVAHARSQRCEGVICGHIHTPAYTKLDGLTYCNTGDWVENCTAFVEYDTGELSLLHYFDEDCPAEEAALVTDGVALATADAETSSGEYPVWVAADGPIPVTEPVPVAPRALA